MGGVEGSEERPRLLTLLMIRLRAARTVKPVQTHFVTAKLGNPSARHQQRRRMSGGILRPLFKVSRVSEEQAGAGDRGRS